MIYYVYMKNKLFAVIALVSLPLLLASCLEPSPPKANYLNYQITRVAAEGIDVNFNFEVENPNPLPIDVSGYSYKVLINGSEFLNEKRAGFSLPASGKSNIVIPLTIRYDRLFGSALSVVEGIVKGQTAISYSIEGSISAGTMGITVATPIKASGTIPIPKELPSEIKF